MSPNGLIGKTWDHETMRKPALERNSDVMWLMWSQICETTNNDRTNIRYIARQNINNQLTQRILARVLQMHWPDDPEIAAGRAPMAPGKKIGKTNDGFAALLGTQNLWSTPYFLIQHSGVLGKKEVKSIIAYNPTPRDSFYQVNLILEIGDVD